MDSHYVTRIENGRSVWTWAFEEESPWIYGGWYSFNFTYGDVGRPIPPNLEIPGGAGPDKPPAIYGSIKATASYDTFSHATCFDETFRLATTGESRRVMRMETPLGNGYKKCGYTTVFANVTPGSHRIERLSTNADGSIVYGVVDCKTVTAGNQATATIRPNWGCPQYRRINQVVTVGCVARTKWRAQRTLQPFCQSPATCVIRQFLASLQASALTKQLADPPIKSSGPVRREKSAGFAGRRQAAT